MVQLNHENNEIVLVMPVKDKMSVGIGEGIITIIIIIIIMEIIIDELSKEKDINLEVNEGILYI